MGTEESGESGGVAALPVGVSSPPWPQAPPTPARNPWQWLAIALLLILSLIIGTSHIRLPYYVEGPGTAPPVAVKIKDGAPVTSEFLLSTVALDSRVSPLRLLAAWLSSDDKIVPRRSVTGGENPAQFDRNNALEMDRSKQDAIVVGLRRMGYPVPEHGDGILVTGTQRQGPSDGRLFAGDVVVEADAKPVRLVQDLTTVLRAKHPGASLALTLDRPNGGRRTVAISLGACPEDVPGCQGGIGPTRAYLGIGLTTSHDKFDFPFPVDIILKEVGGPSAGLAFTLGVIEALAKHPLADGRRVAVTGTIDLNGGVGPIGGIELKTVAVERAGADYFLVPKDTGIPGDEGQYSAAVAKARGHHLKVIAVGNLEEALNALRTIGGDLSGVGPAAPHPLK